MLYIAVWLITLFISVYLFQKVSGSLSILKPNMISIIFYYSLLVTCFIGSLLIVLNIDENYMLIRMHNPEVRVIGFYWICYIMIFMPLSMLLISSLLGFNPKKEYNEFLKSPIMLLSNKGKDFFPFFTVLTGISLLSIVYTVVKLDSIPLLELFRGADNLGELRIEASHGFNGNIYIRNIFALGLTPVLSFIAYIYAVKTKLITWRIYFILLFIPSIIMSIYDLQKAPIFFYFLMFLLINIYIGKFKLTFKKVVLLGTVGVTLLVVLYVFVQGVTSANQFLTYKSGPVGRLILSQIAPFFLHLDLFGSDVPYLNGKSLPSMILGLYDIEQVRSARLVMEQYFPDKVEKGIAGVLNTIFAGEAFANFGYIGILLGTIYLGILIQTVYIFFLRLPKHPVVISLFVFFTVNFPRVVVGGFTDFIFNPFWVFINVLLLGILLLIKFKNDFITSFSSFLEKKRNSLQ